MLQPARGRPALNKLNKLRALPGVADARMRATGFLSVIFVGGLGLAVLAGPSSCACAIPSSLQAQQTAAATESPDVSRFAYMQVAAHTDDAADTETPSRPSEQPAVQPASRAADELASRFAGSAPRAKTAAALPPDETIGVSSISTSAIRTRDTLERRDDVAPQKPDRLPAKIEPIADEAPAKIRVAAAAPIDSDVVDTLPAVDVAPPQVPTEVAAEAERKYTPSARTRVANKSKPRRPTKILGYKSGVLPASIKTGKTAPRWAQKMFDNPWQTKAFSYQ
jgi:hypothetical protein